MALALRGRKGRRRPVDPSPAPNRWIITYTDLCTLLLAFFVLLVSMSTLDGNRQRRALRSVSETLEPGRREATLSGERAAGHGAGVAGDGESGADMAQIRELAARAGVAPQQLKTGERLVYHLSCSMLLEPGTEGIALPIRDFLIGLAHHIKESGEELELRGHTDPLEGSGREDWEERSWDLSTRRAQTVYSFLKDQGVEPRRMSAHGFSHYRPVVDPRAFPGLSAKNARVEIVIGPNRTLPAQTAQQHPKDSPYFNYKHFFYTLFPASEESAGRVTGGLGHAEKRSPAEH